MASTEPVAARAARTVVSNPTLSGASPLPAGHGRGRRGIPVDVLTEDGRIVRRYRTRRASRQSKTDRDEPQEPR